jgi:hypothetical protein
MKKAAKLKKILLISALSVVALALIFFLYTFGVIYREVKATCLQAQKEYQEDCVNSLIKLVQSEEKTFRERNTAIWALGQLADKQALPVLQTLYTGKIPPKESLSRALSQYELKKAIQWCEKGNATSWMYRNRGSWQ